MRVAIIGDSYTYTYKDTYLETICNELNLEVIHQVGFRGLAEYRIYLEFLEIIKNNPEIIICCHTEHSRLYHPTEKIKKPYGFEINYNKNFRKIAKEYFIHFYNEDFSKFIHNLIICEMQKICKEKNIKLINIPCFEHNHVVKNYGLWILANGGLSDCSNSGYKREFGQDHWTVKNDATLLNHFSPHGHQVLANNIIPHIKTYITSDQEFHIALLFPELFD